MSEALKKERGERVKKIRGMLGLNAFEFSELCNCSQSAIRKWELGAQGGLTEKGADLIVQGALSKDIVSNSLWLLEGTGTPPFFIMDHSISNLDEISQEIHLFTEASINHVTFKLPDNSMIPQYLPGDIIGGNRYYSDSIRDCDNKICIVQLKNGDILARKLNVNTQGVLLTCLNLTADASPRLFEEKIMWAAPITRMWREK